MNNYKEILQNSLNELLLVNYRYTNNVTYVLPFKITSTDDIHEHHAVLTDLVDDKRHEIEYHDILSIEVREAEKNDPVTLEGMVEQMKNLGGWFQHNFCKIDSDPNINEKFRSKYFHSHQGGKVSPEQAYVMVKMKVETLQELYDMDLLEFKRRWVAFMEEYRIRAVNTLVMDRDEAHEEGDEDEAEEIEIILEMLNDIQDEYLSLVEDLETKNDVLKCWPPMLLPFPSITL